MASGEGVAGLGDTAGWERTGRQLYAVVERYTMLGDHRTGTRFDVATREWLKLQILKRGGTVSEAPYQFDGWVPTWEITCGGEPVDSLPLWYCGDGELDRDGVDPVRVQTYGTSTPLELERAIERAEADGDTLVIASTDGRTGRAIAINRDARPPTGPGVLLVGPDDVDRLRTGRVTAFVRSWVRTVRSANVVGRFGRSGHHPVVVATPISGWFTSRGRARDGRRRRARAGGPAGSGAGRRRPRRHHRPRARPRRPPLAAADLRRRTPPRSCTSGRPSPRAIPRRPSLRTAAHRAEHAGGRQTPAGPGGRGRLHPRAEARAVARRGGGLAIAGGPGALDDRHLPRVPPRGPTPPIARPAPSCSPAPCGASSGPRTPSCRRVEPGPAPRPRVAKC